MVKRITTTVLITLTIVVGTVASTHAAPEVSNLLLEASSHNSLAADDLICIYDLTDATTSAVAWYRDGNPFMEFYLPFEGSGTSSQLDFSGNGHSVTATGSPVWEPTGGPNGSGAYLFNSTNRFEAEVFPTLSSYTKVAWVQMTGLGASNNILSSQDATGGHTFWASHTQGYRLSAGQAGSWVIAQDPTPLVIDQWYFVAVTFDYATGEMILYKDDQIVDNATVLSGNRGITDATLQVGTFVNGSGWKGRIAEAQIYDFVVSPEQILALYHGSDTIRSTETTVGEDWQAEVTPFSSTEAGTSDTTNTLTIMADPPIVSDIPGETIAEGGTFATIALDDYVTDANHLDNEIVWTYSGNTDLIVDITSRVATISTPYSDWYGTETITFRATDPDGLYNEDAAIFTVTAVNDAPVVADIPDETIAEGSTFATINLDDYVSDVDNSDADMAWTSSGNTDLIVDITDRVATISTPHSDWHGTETITFRATDPDDLWDEDAATFTVNAVNDAPVVSDIPNETIAEGGSFATINLDDYVDDVDNSDAEMIWTYSGDVALSVDITDRVATITTPGAEWSGWETITFRATDPDDLWDEDAATFTVTAVNDAPVVSDIPNETIAEGGSFATINLDDYVDDVDNTDADMTWTYSGNTDLIVDITDRVATISTPHSDWHGTETITFRATDPDDLWDEDAATFTVNAVNDPPVVSDIPDQTIDEGSSFVTINLDDYVDDVDNTDASMVWTASGDVTLSVDIADRVATITTPGAEWNGSELITFRATDPGSLWDEDAATFTVNAVNDPPVVSDIPDQTIDEGSSFVTINLDDYVDDVDNTDASMVWTASDDVTLSVDITDRVATITTPGAEWNGSELITFRATDPDDLWDEDAATFTVTAVNDPPMVSDIPDELVSQDSPFAPIDLDNYVSDIDNDPDEMTWTYSGAVNLLVTIDDFTRTATVDVLSAYWYGSETITFRCTDPGGLFAEDAATFTVDADPGVEAVTLSATSINPLTTDDLSCSYTLTGNATTAAIAWYKDSNPFMEFYLPFEGSVTSSQLDFSGNGHTVAVFGSPVWEPTGGPNGSGAYLFNSTNRFEAEVFPTLSSYTKVAWVLMTEPLFSHNILSSQDAAGGHTFWASQSQGNRLSAGQAGTWTIAQDPTPLVLDQWYFVAVTFDYATGEMILYKDDQIVDNVTVPTNRRDITDGTLQVGTFGDGSGWKGRIAEAHIYDFVVSPEQILALYHGTDTIRSTETDVFDQWRAEVTPFGGLEVGPTVSSNTLLIGFVNQSPVLDTILPDTVDVGRQMTFVVSASDPDPQAPPFLVADSLPTGATLSDHENGTGTFDWTPDFDQYGDFPIIFKAQDDSLAVDSQVVIITVIPDTTAPTLVLISPPDDSITTNPYMLLSMTVTDTNPMVLWVYGGTTADTTSLVYVQENITSTTENYEWTARVLKPDAASTVGLWHLDDHGSESITDESAYGNNGQLSGSPSWSPEGRLGYALEFDGTDGYAEIPDDPSLDIDPVTGAVTMEVWVNPDISGDGQLRSVMAKRAYGSRARTVNYEMLLNFDRKVMFAAGEGTSTIYLSSIILPAGQWSYVAITLDASEKTALFYLNGMLADSVNNVMFGPTHDEPLYIGAAGPSSEPFMGRIDEVRVSNRVLGPSEIEFNHKLGHGEYFWWARVTDASGNGDTSEVRHFVVNTPESQAPELIAPPDTPDSILYDMIPTFSWTPWLFPVSYDTIYYRLRVAMSSDFTMETVIDSIIEQSFTWIYDSLEFNQQFWWKIEGWVNTDTGLVTVSSNVLSFHTWTLGDMDHTHTLDISDLVYLVDYMFLGGAPISPLCVGDIDINDDGDCLVDISDLVYLVDYMFTGGPAPVAGCVCDED